MDELMMLLPDSHRNQIKPGQVSCLEEIRLRTGQPILLRQQDSERAIWPQVNSLDLERVIQTACKQSVYAYTESLKQGYLTVKGGHRIGICGSGVVRNGLVTAMKYPSSVNIRVAREVRGCAEGLETQLNGSVLIVGPPGCGKTTLLRDLIRLLSDREGFTVGLADERGEISAVHDGMSQLYVGRRTDILTGIGKGSAVMMLLRTMNPDWIALDEITEQEDIRSISYASYCGVRLIATAHALSELDLKRRPLYRSMMESGVFSHVISMKRDKSFTVGEWRQ